jgi:hypothetical protein
MRSPSNSTLGSTDRSTSATPVATPSPARRLHGAGRQASLSDSTHAQAAARNARGVSQPSPTALQGEDTVRIQIEDTQSPSPTASSPVGAPSQTSSEASRSSLGRRVVGADNYGTTESSETSHTARPGVECNPASLPQSSRTATSGNNQENRSRSDSPTYDQFRPAISNVTEPSANVRPSTSAQQESAKRQPTNRPVSQPLSVENSSDASSESTSSPRASSTGPQPGSVPKPSTRVPASEPATSSEHPHSAVGSEPISIQLENPSEPSTSPPGSESRPLRDSSRSDPTSEAFSDRISVQSTTPLYSISGTSGPVEYPFPNPDDHDPSVHSGSFHDRQDTRHREHQILIPPQRDAEEPTGRDVGLLRRNRRWWVTACVTMLAEFVVIVVLAILLAILLSDKGPTGKNNNRMCNRTY